MQQTVTGPCSEIMRHNCTAVHTINTSIYGGKRSDLLLPLLLFTISISPDKAADVLFTDLYCRYRLKAVLFAGTSPHFYPPFLPLLAACLRDKLLPDICQECWQVIGLLKAALQGRQTLKHGVTRHNCGN